ncbi:hypothetical protein [Flavobacterium quisquiliarum]|uniref:Uncharacterized protein n=2 Tax=Flavobacterium quisquiliarum TaxID=1834436 RepID=A0ABV8W9Z2_9FLAO|nr:hypothetical protein [Flavobacterium collinsii]
MLIFALFIVLVLFLTHQATKKSPEFLQNEKLQMEEKVKKLKKDILNWKSDSLKNVTNGMDYSFVRSMTNKLTGVLNSNDGTPIIAFQRVDRGIFVNSRILASSTDFKIYCEFKNEEKIFYFNDVYLGKIVKHFDILDASNNKIGRCNRKTSQPSFTVDFRFGKAAEILKNSDRKFMVQRRYRKRNQWESEMVFRDLPPPTNLILSLNTTDPEELKWVISLTVFEAVYYGFSFVS